ncbi:MAG: pyridoxamine 5'-phosphate oxidase family protein [Chloroflexi bacterium]|nr:pyridoxamine 5'-phosphate oxidase family protein [Chloroflexota bacterium]MDA1228086.1 pyridoxamine 5'-phosphate oxidase family protein [Chloroflexota bacterium]
MKVTERTKIKNHPERTVTDETSEILLAGSVAHVGFVDDGMPYVIPLSYHYDAATPDKIYLHGAMRSRAMDLLATGAPMCVTVTLTDGLVYSRKAMNHSINYRSVVLFGKGHDIVDEDRKFELFDKMVQRYFPGRNVGEHYNAPPSADLGITALVEVDIEEWNAKARRGGPTGPDDNKPDAKGTAGVVDLREV